jgi:hypothetical protein
MMERKPIETRVIRFTGFLEFLDIAWTLSQSRDEIEASHMSILEWSHLYESAPPCGQQNAALG